MVKDTFIKLIQNPEQISSSELESIDEVLKSFPYCSSAVLLSAKGNHDKGGMFSSQKIKAAAMYANNRGVLKNLIEKKTPTTSKILDNEPVQRIEVLEKTQQELVVKSLADQVLDRVHELQIIKSQKELIQSDEKLMPPIEQAEKNDQILELPQQETSPLKFYVHKSEFGKEVRNASHDLIGEYLKYRFITQIEPTDLEQQSSIIDKFINTNGGTIKPIKTSTNLPNLDLSKNSTVLDTELVTENMANIFLKQEKFKKAIEVYQKLSLKYPEKDAYFAEKIIYIQSISN